MFKTITSLDLSTVSGGDQSATEPAWINKARQAGLNQSQLLAKAQSSEDIRWIDPDGYYGGMYGGQTW